MKCVQSNKLDFSGQNIYVGIDVHLKSWSVAILSEHSVLKRFSQSPEPEALHKYLVSNYPGANYFSVYEAGFCGFWIHERLTDLGITNIVVNPADVPTMSKENFVRQMLLTVTSLLVNYVPVHWLEYTFPEWKLWSFVL
ncbi:MAG: hypothetical protein ACLTSS_05150 [Phocaeicola coprocola]